MKAWRHVAAGDFPQKLLLLVVGICCLLFMSAGLARAQSAASVDALQAQVKALQEQIDALKAAISQPVATPGTTAAAVESINSLQAQIKDLQQQVDALKGAAAKPVTAPSEAGAPSPGGKNILTTTFVKVTLGGFIEAAGIYRNLNTGSDVNSKFNLGAGGFPLPNSPNYYMDEFRGTARQSRLSLLAQGQDDFAALATYFEMDFLGGGSGFSGNSQESNSYSLRIRQLYETYDTPSGWHLLAGQAWSLITMNKLGIVPRQENIPLTIDAQYVPGFTWTRNPQVRLVKDFGSMVSAGVSVEAPQAIITGGGLTAGSTAVSGHSSDYTYHLANPADYAYIYNTTNNSNMPGSLSLDQYPDLVAKVAVDPGFGHYEVYGLGRFFTDRTLVGTTHDNNTTFGWGAGGGMLLPVVPKLLDFQGSILAGQGIGRYGSCGFSDAVVNPITGKLDALTEVEAMVGLIARPTDRLNIYGYAGMEQESRKDILGTTGGFGNPAYAPLALLTEGSTVSSSLVQAASVSQGTIGFWYSFYKGIYGEMRVGLSDSLTHLVIFGGLPNENMNITMISLRYYPF